MSDDPKDPKPLIITEISGPDRRATGQLPKMDRFELLFVDMKDHVDERFRQAEESNTEKHRKAAESSTENHRKTNAHVQTVANQVKGLTGRVGALEDRVKAVEHEVETNKTESDQRLKTHSERAADAEAAAENPSEHDLAAQAAIAKEITDRQTREGELAKDVSEIKANVAPIVAKLASVETGLAAIKEETQSQTNLFKRHLNRLMSSRVVQTIAIVGLTSIATSISVGRCVVAVPANLQNAAPPGGTVILTPPPAPANSNPATFATPR